MQTHRADFEVRLAVGLESWIPGDMTCWLSSIYLPFYSKNESPARSLFQSKCT